MSQRILNVGLIGFGLSGRYFHAPFLSVNPRFNLKTVVERSKNEAQAYDPSIQNARTAEAMLEDPAIDLVFICSPNDSHYRYAKQALEHGKNVVIEKPFANSEIEAQQLSDIAKSNNLIVSAYQNRRWDSDFLTIKKLIHDGALGDVVEFQSRYDRFRPIPVANTWKEENTVGSGNLFNLGPHLIDQALDLFGTPYAVTADIRTLRTGSTVDDYFDIRLDYLNKVVILKSSLMVYAHDLRYAIHGTKGSFLKGGLDAQEETLRRGILPGGPDWGIEPEERWGKLSADNRTEIIKSEAGDYMCFYDSLYEAVVNGQEPAVKPEEAVRTARVIDLAFQSSKEKISLKY